MPRPTAPLHRIAACVLALASGAALAQDAGKAARFYEDALKRYENKDVPGAIVQLKNALQADKSQLSVHLLLGRALLADGQPAAAEVAFSDAIRMGVNRSEVAVALAQALNAQGRQTQMLADPRLAPEGLPPEVLQPLLLERAAALSDLGQGRNALNTVLEARRLDPARLGSWLAEVPLRIRAQQWSDAMTAADQALKLQPGDASSLYQRASVLHASGRLREALADYDRALASNPDHFESRVARAGLLADLNRANDALVDIAAAEKLHAKDPRATYLRALLAERAGDLAGSKAALKQVTDLLDPVPIDYLRYRTQFLMLNGLAHFGLSEFGKAQPYLELAARQQPGSSLLKLLAQIQVSEGNQGKALELLDDYLRAHPKDSQALLMKASIQINQGQGSRAAVLMQEALKNQDLPDLRAALGVGLMQAGQDRTALPELEKAYKADPNQVYAALALVRGYARNGRPADAEKISSELVRKRPNDAGVLMLDAWLRQTLGDTGGARSGFERVLRLDARLIDAHIGLARVDTLARSYDAAEKRLKDLLKGNERRADVQFELALLNELRGRDDEAEKWLSSAAEAGGPRELRADFALVEWRLRKGKPALALQAAKALAAKQPEDMDVLRTLARAQAANGDTAGARSSLTTAQRKASYNSPQLLAIARQQLEINDLDGAAYGLDKALSATPDDLQALALMAEVDLRRRDATAADSRIRQLLKLAPRSAAGPLLQADLARLRNQPQAEVEALRRALDVAPSPAVAARLVTTWSRQGQLRDARAEADRWLAKHPRDTLVLKAIGDAEARSDGFAAARQRYEAALKVQPNDIEALNSLANALIRLKDPAATRVADQALALRPKDALLLDTAGWASFQAGQPERALTLLREARLRAPGHPEIRYHLGAVLLAAGKRQEAREELQGALKSAEFDGIADAKRLLLTLN